MAKAKLPFVSEKGGLPIAEGGTPHPPPTSLKHRTTLCVQSGEASRLFISPLLLLPLLFNSFPFPVCVYICILLWPLPLSLFDIQRPLGVLFLLPAKQRWLSVLRVFVVVRFSTQFLADHEDGHIAAISDVQSNFLFCFRLFC